MATPILGQEPQEYRTEDSVAVLLSLASNPASRETAEAREISVLLAATGAA